MNLDELTLGQLKEIRSLLGEKDSSTSAFKVGKCYMIRTVTMINVGCVEFVNEQEIVLSGASWVADTGRYFDALEKGKLKEVEPYPGGFAIIGRGSIVDAQNWSHDLPDSQK